MNAFIEKLRNFIALTASDEEALRVACQNQRQVPARYDLIREGDKPGPVYAVLKGWACRYKLLPDGSRQIMAFLMPGDFCDLDVGLLDEMDHSIATLTEARVAMIARDDIEQLMQARPPIARGFLRIQLVDEGILRAWIVSMGRRSSIERVAHLMCELYIRMRNVGLADNNHCDMPLAQIVIADALGLTPVHVNRVLRQLRERGAMTLGRGTLTIDDAAALAEIAGFDENYLHRRIKLAA